MKKSILIIVSIVLLLIIAALLCIVPWDNWNPNGSEDGTTSQMPIDFTLNAIKLDAVGNEIGTAQIHIHGYRLPFIFPNERIVLTIDPFDDLYQIEDSEVNGEIGHIKYIGKEPNTPEFMRLSFIAKSTNAEGMVDCTLTFSPDMECFAFRCYPFGSDYEEATYIASVSGDYSTRELIEFFNGLVPGL